MGLRGSNATSPPPPSLWLNSSEPSPGRREGSAGAAGRGLRRAARSGTAAPPAPGLRRRLLLPQPGWEERAVTFRCWARPASLSQQRCRAAMSQVGAATRSSPSPRPAPGCSAPQPPGCWAGSQPPPGPPRPGFGAAPCGGCCPAARRAPARGIPRDTGTFPSCVPPPLADNESLPSFPSRSRTNKASTIWCQDTLEMGPNPGGRGMASLHPHARPHLELQARVGLGRALHRAGAAPAAPAPCSAGARLHSSARLCSEPLVPFPACSGAEDRTEAAHGSPSSCGGSGSDLAHLRTGTGSARDNALHPAT